MKTAPIACLCAASFLTGIGLITLAFGPLNPPAGPVSSTLKPLAEIEPRIAMNATNTPGDANSVFRITLPGSYYLTGNVSVGNGFNGIEIETANVTLDLNGFRIIGTPASLDGVWLNAAASNVTIRNGSMRSMGSDGIDAESSESVRVIDVTVRNCDGRGVAILTGGTLTNVIADSNLLDGIRLSSHGTITNCVARGNGTDGFLIGSGVTMTGCTASENTDEGVSAGSTCNITGCAVTGNGDAGISIGGGGSVTDCTVTSNGGGGVAVTGPGVTVSRVTASGNTGTGIAGGTCTSVLHCTAYNNTVDGISVGNGSTVMNCVSRENDQDGFQIPSSTIARANAAAFNSVNEMLVIGNGNRVEENNLVSNGVALRITGSDNVILRNTARSGAGSYYSIVSGNYYGPIIDRVGVATPGVATGPAAGVLATTDPHSNFMY